MSFFASRDNNLPHPKKVWKHFTRAVRSGLPCLGIPKPCLRKRRRLALNSSKVDICYHHRQQHHFLPCHGPDNRHLSQRSMHKGEETQRFGDHREDGRNYQNASGEEQVFWEAFRCEEVENGNVNVVDLKAQEFIENFYERLKLEQHHSWEEYHSMLARGT